MGETVTLELPDTLLRSARQVARDTRRSLEDVLLDWLSRAIQEPPVELLSEAEVLALRDFEMTREQQTELGDLLERQREALLSANERVRLDELMTIYRRGLVRKAQALKVAVDRGLQPPSNAT